MEPQPPPAPVPTPPAAPEPPPSRGRRLLTVRSALVFALAVLAGLGGAGLLYAAHQPVALIAIGAIGICVGAVRLLDSLIEEDPRQPGT